MLTKEKLIETINHLPSRFSVEDVIDSIYLCYKIETGLQQSENKQVTPDQDLEKKLPEWLV